MRRGQTNSSNKINNYKEEIETMRRINDYREKAFIEICSHDKKIKKINCSKCISLIDEKSQNMIYE